MTSLQRYRSNAEVSIYFKVCFELLSFNMQINEWLYHALHFQIYAQGHAWLSRYNLQCLLSQYALQFVGIYMRNFLCSTFIQSCHALNVSHHAFHCMYPIMLWSVNTPSCLVLYAYIYRYVCIPSFFALYVSHHALLFMYPIMLCNVHRASP